MHNFRNVKPTVRRNLEMMLTSIDLVSFLSSSCRYLLIIDTQEYHYQDILPQSKPIIQLAIFMIVCCHVILGLPRRGCSWLFAMSGYIVQTTMFRLLGIDRPDRLPADEADILNTFPKDVRTAMAQFNLESKATIYAVCPKCHQTYAPTYEDNNPIPVYPEFCGFKPKPGRRRGRKCRELLVRPKILNGHKFRVPIKTFVAFDLKDWMAELLSRPGYEKQMDASWERMKPSSDGNIHDIFQGDIIRDFKGPGKKKTHFSLAGPGEGRYLVSMNADSFNPLTNQQAGKKISVTAILLVCLSLPPEIRYKPENIFLAGLIPSPDPPLDRINPYLVPIVKALLEFWDPGVHFTCTHDFPHGRLVFIALVLVVCDLPGARKLVGFASHRHNYFCAVCWCTRKEPGYANYEVDEWNRRDYHDWRLHAEKYKDAETAQDADSIFDTSGCRWSALLDLPYFDPSRFVVVDPMHNLFLGLIKEHFHEILGFRQQNSKDELVLGIVIPEDPANPVPTSENDEKDVKKGILWLEKPMELANKSEINAAERRFSRLRKPSLVHIALGLSLLVPKDFANPTPSPMPRKTKKPSKNPRSGTPYCILTKQVIAERIVRWVCFSWVV